MAQWESRRALGQTFDLSAEAYDAARPAYPASLVDHAIERGSLAADSHVLEVGCGTGKLTEMLVARGLVVDAVDPGPNMIAVARRRLDQTGGVTFHLARFEDVELPAQSFEAVFSATAFHWVDPAVGWAKAAAHLSADGLLALLSYVSIRDERSGQLQDEFVALLRKHAPEIAAESRPFGDLDALIAGAEERSRNVSEVWEWLLQGGLQRPTLATPEAADLFENVEVAYEAYEIEETADEWVALFRTTALHQRLDSSSLTPLEDDLRSLVEVLGGTIRSAVAHILMTARRS